MKKFNFFLLASFFVTLLSGAHACGQDDPELEETLNRLKPRAFGVDRRFPNLPTEEDINRLEVALLNPGYQLPSSLKKYHLAVGNLIFSGIDEFPTINSIQESDGTFRSDLLYFIREGHEKGIPNKMPEVWIPFAGDNGEYICINLQTKRVCYFSVVPRLKKDKEEYPTLSAWIREMLLSE